ncbi:MAG: alpha/beta hydrolase [Bacteroidales bacterium]
MKTFIKYNSVNIHYKTEGKGDALVLLHGFTESLEIWDDFSAELSLFFKVICVDLPGHGSSDCIGESHTMELMADVVKTVLDEENMKECVMIGHSMGGYIALAFAEKHPAYMKGLGLFHSSALPDTPEGKANRTRAIEVIEKNHTEFVMNFIPDLFAPANRKPLEKEINVLVEKAQTMSKQAIIAAQRGMMERRDMQYVLKNADYPVLFIAGKQDTRVPYNKVLEQIVLPKDTTALLLHDIAHMGYLEARDKTIYAVKCFVDGAY